MSKTTNPSRVKTLIVYLERRKSKERVGHLEKRLQDGKTQYEFVYDDRYLQRKMAIPLGPEFPLTKKKFTSRKLFSSFEDRIPSRENPAFAEYCNVAGISTQEIDEIVLLSTIGRKGPSSFIFELEPVQELIGAEIRNYRKKLDLTVRDFSAAFDVSPASIQKLEHGKSEGSEVIKRLKIYLTFPNVALYEVQKNKASLHSMTYQKIIKRLKVDYLGVAVSTDNSVPSTSSRSKHDAQ